MGRLLALLPFLPALAFAASLSHFDVEASFVPAKKAGGTGRVAVSFSARDPDLRVNEMPAPQLRLDLLQTVLIEAQPPVSKGVQGQDSLTKYHDLSEPVLFPVMIAPTAPAGDHFVKATVVFFYCSQREGWCRRGTAEVEIPVSVR